MRRSIEDVGPNPAPSAEQIAAYIASLSRELKILADSQHLGALSYLLDLVQTEAEERAHPAKPRKIAL